VNVDIEEAGGERVCGAVGAAGVDPDDLCVVDQDLGIVNLPMRRQQAARPQRCLHFLRFLPYRRFAESTAGGDGLDSVNCNSNTASEAGKQAALQDGLRRGQKRVWRSERRQVKPMG
jgi:hypothetical protein